MIKKLLVVRLNVGDIHTLVIPFSYIFIGLKIHSPPCAHPIEIVIWLSRCTEHILYITVESTHSSHSREDGDSVQGGRVFVAPER
jgi:hypothetical protein